MRSNVHPSEAVVGPEMKLTRKTPAGLRLSARRESVDHSAPRNLLDAWSVGYSPDDTVLRVVVDPVPEPGGILGHRNFDTGTVFVCGCRTARLLILMTEPIPDSSTPQCPFIHQNNYLFCRNCHSNCRLRAHHVSRACESRPASTLIFRAWSVNTACCSRTGEETLPGR
jgi:hypothetical protein